MTLLYFFFFSFCFQLFLLCVRVCFFFLSPFAHLSTERSLVCICLSFFLSDFISLWVYAPMRYITHYACKCYEYVLYVCVCADVYPHEIILKFISHSHIVLTILKSRGALYDVDNEQLNQLCAFRLVCSQSWPALFSTHNTNLCLSKIAITECHRTGKENDFNAENCFVFLGKCRAQQQTCEKHKHCVHVHQKNTSNKYNIIITLL